jgi:hypothetical protein
MSDALPEAPAKLRAIFDAQPRRSSVRERRRCNSGAQT